MPEVVGRLRTPRLATPPASPAVGEMYYDTATNLLKWWDGTSWVISTGGSAPVYDTDQIGTVKAYSGKVIPTNWMLADGRTLTRTNYPELADAYGVPVGTESFQIPDLRNRMLYGATDPTAQGANGGAATHTLTAAELAAHQHPVYGTLVQPAAGHLFGGSANQYFNASGYVAVDSWFSAGAEIAVGVNYNTPAGAAHNNMPPYITVAFIVKVTGVQINSGGALVGPTGPSYTLPARLATTGTQTTDCSAATDAGFYWANTTCANAPVANYFQMLVLSLNGPTDLRQVAYEFNSERSWQRRRTSGAWGAWEEVGSIADEKKTVVKAGAGSGDSQIYGASEIMSSPGANDLRHTITPSRNLWWEIEYWMIVRVADAAWLDLNGYILYDLGYATDELGRASGQYQRVTTHSALVYQGMRVSSVLKCLAGRTYTVRCVVSPSGGTWFYYTPASYLGTSAKVVGYW